VPSRLFKPVLVLILVFIAFPVAAADALFRSSFESSICNNSVPETELNDTAALANPVVLDPATASAMICGAIIPVGDQDYFRLAITSTATMLVETIRADGVPCDPTTPMSLTLFDSSVTVIATDNNGGVGGCASLDGVTSSMLQNLTPGSYYIRVNQSSNNFVIPTYALSIRLL
jgi:hypothetical protein